MLDPVFEEEGEDVCEAQKPDQHHGSSSSGNSNSSPLAQLTIRVPSRKISPLGRPARDRPRPTHEQVSRQNQHRLISRHNPRVRRANIVSTAVGSAHGPSCPPISDPSPSSTTSSNGGSQHSTPASIPVHYSPCPPPDPKCLSEEALLHALHNIRIEEEEELHFRRKSLHIVEIPVAVLPLPPAIPPSQPPEAPEGRMDSPQAKEAGANGRVHQGDTEADENLPPYADCNVYQLACSKERLRDMEQQLQNTVCMMQDTVELVTRRLRAQASAGLSSGAARQGGTDAGDPTETGEGHERKVNAVVEEMREKLARLASAHERVSLEHGLVARELGGRPGNW